MAYRELGELFAFYSDLPAAEFDAPAADKFDRLRAAKMRIGTRDLKIAAICLVTGGVLLTANRRDFEKVPGLRFENWLD
ncbi:MAG: type II toxin-antitoxin system VapC family toxin [Gemmataceae bacterium]